MRLLPLTLCLLALAIDAFSADPYDLTRMPPVGWVRGSTVGIVGYPDGPPPRTNGVTFINANLAPYNADPNGATDSLAGINAALAAAPSNSVVALTNGTYKISNTLSLSKNGVTLRGPAYNTVTIYCTNAIPFKLGPSEPPTGATTGIFSGSSRGSTNIVLSGTTLAVVGDIIYVQQRNTTNENRQVLSTVGFQNLEKTTCRVMSKPNSTNIVVWPPVDIDYTNSPSIVLISAKHIGAIFTPIEMSGVENINFTQTYGGVTANVNFVARWTYTYNCWMKNVRFVEPRNYNLDNSVNVNGYIGGCTFRQKDGALPTSNHAGLLSGNTSCLQIENCLFENRLFPGWEFNGGSYVAVYATQFTNNWSDILCHGAHPKFFLFEGVNANVLLLDGYFGSTSEHTLFRSSFNIGGFPVISFKRLATRNQVIGCSLGTNSVWEGFNYGTNQGNHAFIYQGGKPNIGNPDHNLGHETPPESFNWPGMFWQATSANNNGYTFPGAQSGTTLSGSFAFFTDTLQKVWIQKAANTNFYGSGDDGNLASATAPGTGSSISLDRTISVGAGDTLYMVGPAAFQQLSLTAANSHLFHGTFDFSSLVVSNNPSYDATLPSSILYSNTPPYWWYRTNTINPSLFVSRFPAIQAESAGTNYANKVTLSPVEIWRFDGTDPFVAGAVPPSPPATGTNPPVIIGGDVILRGGVNARIHL